jgi:phosphate transport system substrate-binding protein
LLLAGVASAAAEPGAPGEGLTFARADTMDGLVRAWAAGFRRLHPGVALTLRNDTRLSADAFDLLLAGRVQVAPFVREPFPAEIARFRGKTGHDPLLVPVATGSYATKGGTHAIAVYVADGNPLAGLTLAQLRAIYARDGGIRTWGQLGLGGPWTARPIHVYGMPTRRSTGNPPGIVNFLRQRVLPDSEFRGDIAECPDSAEGSSLDRIVRAVASDPDGIGCSGFGNAAPGARTLALAEGEGGPYYAGTPDEVARRIYPLTRTIYLCVDRAPGRPLDPRLGDFIAFVLGPEGQKAVADDPERFLPLPPEMARAEVLKLAAQPPDVPPDAGYLAPSGAVEIVGYNDMREMIEAWDRLYSAAHPGVAFALSLEGTRTAPPALAAGRSAFAPMGAVFSPSELADYRRATGGEPLAIRVAHCSLDPRALSGPLAIIVNRDNPLASISMEQVARVFTGEVTTWGGLGLEGDWAGKGVRACGLSPGTALGSFMRSRALGGSPFLAGLDGCAQSAEVVRRVAADPLAIGFAAAMRASPGVRVLAIAPGGSAAPVAPTPESIRDGRYPLDRCLLIYARRPLDPFVRAYLRMALSPEGQRAVAGGTLGYQPLNPREIAEELRKLAN